MAARIVVRVRAAHDEVRLGFRPIVEDDGRLDATVQGVAEAGNEQPGQPVHHGGVRAALRGHRDDRSVEELDAFVREEPDLAHAVVFLPREAMRRRSDVPAGTSE
jgi:hypothetical protein